MSSAEVDPTFESLLNHLRQSRGFDFTGYKRSTIIRRVRRRMQMINLESFADYLDYLEVYPEEFSFLFNTILINVTGFFRDRPAWEYLQQHGLPILLNSKPSNAPIRIWSAGCASGEEAYTLAMLLAEILGIEQFRQRVKIYATDVDEEALNQARQAIYSSKEIHEVSAELRQKYFEPSGNHFVFRNDLRRSVIFGRHDLLQDAPISRLDLLVCRNTLMYFNAEAQRRVLARFHFALNDSGYLFLGKAEMLLTHSNLFNPVDLKYRIFTKVSATNMRDRLFVLAQAGDEESGNRLSRQIRLRESAFDTSPIAQVVVDLQGNLFLANEQARVLFGLSLRDLGRPFQDLELSYRPVELRSLIERAYSERRLVSLTRVGRYLPDSSSQYLDVRIQPLQDNGNNLLGINITFEDVTHFNILEEELQRSRQELETTSEELQSTNEELETTNEELQSTNEELETTNEELQSTNEELETINHELSQRTNELNRTNVFLRSILSSLQAGVVVIDHNFNILIWNYVVEDLWGLRVEEVIGQSLYSLDIGLPVEQLRIPIRDALSGRRPFQEFLLDATNRRGRNIRCYLTCTPLLGSEIEGVILMMADNHQSISPLSVQERPVSEDEKDS